MIFSSAGSDHENPLLDPKPSLLDRIIETVLGPSMDRMPPDAHAVTKPDFTPLRTHRCPGCEREYTVKYGSTVECGRCGGQCEPIPVKALVMGKERLELINDDQLDYQAIEDWRSAAFTPGWTPDDPVNSAIRSTSDDPLLQSVIDRMSRWLERNAPRPSREVYRWMPHLGGWVYRGVRRG